MRIHHLEDNLSDEDLTFFLVGMPVGDAIDRLPVPVPSHKADVAFPLMVVDPGYYSLDNPVPVEPSYTELRFSRYRCVMRTNGHYEEMEVWRKTR